MGKKKAVRTVNDAIQEAQAGLREKNEATATATATIPAKPLALDQITKEIAEKERQLCLLQDEVSALKELAIAPIQALAASLGYHLARTIIVPATAKKAATAKAATADKAAIAEWLLTNAAKPIEKAKLVEQFKASGLGQRLRLDKYEDVVTVSSDDIVTLKK